MHGLGVGESVDAAQTPVCQVDDALSGGEVGERIALGQRLLVSADVLLQRERFPFAEGDVASRQHQPPFRDGCHRFEWQGVTPITDFDLLEVDDFPRPVVDFEIVGVFVAGGIRQDFVDYQIVLCRRGGPAKRNVVRHRIDVATAVGHPTVEMQMVGDPEGNGC